MNNSVKVRVFMASKTYSDGTRPVRIEFYFSDNTRYTKTLFRINPDQWKNGKVVKHPNVVKLNLMVQSELSKATEYILDCTRLGLVIDPNVYFNSQKLTLLAELIQSEAQERMDNGKYITGRKIKYTGYKVAQFNEKTTLNINHDWADRYAAFCFKKGNAVNTVRNDLKVIKAVLNKAIRKGLIASNPLDGYKLMKEDTIKEKLTIEEIQMFEAANLEGYDKLAVEVFLFSLYHWGMRFYDVVTLRKDQIINGRIIYTSHKANKNHEIDIIYHTSEYDGDYVFPFMNNINKEQSKWMIRVHNVNRFVNNRLKKIAKKIGINKKVTMHIARHSFASIADEKGLSLNDIRELLGHSDVSTTAKYIKSIQKSDALNEKVRGLFN